MGKENMDIICFYWQGKDRPGWQDKSLGEKYVNRLYNGVKRNLSLPFRFICFTNVLNLELNSEIVKSKMEMPSALGCLPKLYAYSPNNGLKGRVIMMDIDLAITGSLDEMFSYDGFFMTRSTFKGKQLSGGDIAFFEAGSLPWIWDYANNHTEWLEDWTGGRERFVYREYLHDKMDFVQNKYPNQLFSYKNHVRGQGLPENARIISCHGNPRPHEINESWIKEHWI